MTATDRYLAQRVGAIVAPNGPVPDPDTTAGRVALIEWVHRQFPQATVTCRERGAMYECVVIGGPSHTSPLTGLGDTLGAAIADAILQIVATTPTSTSPAPREARTPADLARLGKRADAAADHLDAVEEATAAVFSTALLPAAWHAIADAARHLAVDAEAYATALDRAHQEERDAP